MSVPQECQVTQRRAERQRHVRPEQGRNHHRSDDDRHAVVIHTEGGHDGGQHHHRQIDPRTPRSIFDVLVQLLSTDPLRRFARRRRLSGRGFRLRLGARQCGFDRQNHYPVSIRAGVPFVQHIQYRLALFRIQRNPHQHFPVLQSDLPVFEHLVLLEKLADFAAVLLL
jgi:hypothetical protein